MAESNEISRMFADIAGQYDRANHLLSCGIDYYWRRKLVSLVKAQNPTSVVDLATGSGDVAFALKKALGKEAKVSGLDFCRPMLEKAEVKKKKYPFAKDLIFYFGDCMDLPLEDASVDVLTIAFGFRNLEDRQRGLSEMKRALRQGGHLYILEFSQPWRWLRSSYYFYLRKMLPCLAKVITGRVDAYDYLVDSIEQFPEREVLSSEIRAVGFKEVQVMSITAGIVAIHHGVA